MTAQAAPRRRGAGWLPVGLVLVGVSGFGFVGVAGHELGPGGAAPLGVLWTVTNVVGAGLFVPVEQELSRRLSAGTASAGAAGRIVRFALWSTALLLAVLCATAAGAGPQLDRALFAGQAGLTWCCVATCVGFALQHVCRGVFAASGRFDRYGIQLVVDGLIRMGGAVGLGALGTFPIVAYGAVLAVAPLVSLAVAVGVPLPAGGEAANRRNEQAGSDAAAASAWGRDVGLVTVGQIGSMLIIGAGPVVATLLARPGEQAAAAVIVGVLVLARVPLLGLYAAQAVQLPVLVRLVARGMINEFRRRVTAMLGLVLGATVVAAVAAWAVGPFAVALALGPGFRIDGADVAVVMTATMVYIGAALTCQALLAVDGHALATACWLGGVLTYAILLMPEWPVVPRVEAGFLGAGAVTVALAIACLRRRCRVLERPRDERPVPVRS